MKATILLSFFLFVFSLPAADEKKVKSEKSYAERLKEAYDEKVKAGKVKEGYICCDAPSKVCCRRETWQLDRQRG